MQNRDERRTVSRRGFIAAAASAGVAGLAGCGGSQSDMTTGGESPDFDVSGSPVSTTDSGQLPSPTLGPEDAAVTVMAFEDYGCGHCQRYSLNIFPKIYAEYIEPGDIRYEFHDFPIPVSQGSVRGANAARAVQHTVSNGAYWAYSEKLYRNQGNLSLKTVGELASSVGADAETVRDAASNRSYKSTIQADRQRGVDMGVQGTPTVFVGDQKVSDYRYDNLSSAIDSALS